MESDNGELGIRGEKFIATLQGLMDVDDIMLLKGILLKDYDELTGFKERWSGDPHRLATSFANVMNAILPMVEGVAARDKFGAAVVLVCCGKLWGCKHHIRHSILCDLTQQSCMIEDVVICPSYEADYDYQLYVPLEKDKVIGCLWCGKPFKRAKRVKEPYNMSDYMCITCQRKLTDLLAGKIAKLTSLALSRRIKQLPGSEDVKKLPQTTSKKRGY